MGQNSLRSDKFGLIKVSKNVNLFDIYASVLSFE